MSPTLELQGAIVSRLKQDSAVGSLCGDRIYDPVPRAPNGNISAQMPFVAILSTDGLTEDADCIPGEEITVNIDCWSSAPGFVEVHKLAAAVKAALHDDDTITLTSNSLVYFQHRQTRTFRDPDGLSSHAALTFDAFIEQP